MNYYFKKNELSYTKEFDRLREKYALQGQIRSNSIIMCEMVFTSDKEFFDTIGMEETKRYFEESYNFICNYKNLGEKNIISAVVHFDETTPHMHLIYIPVIHTKDKNGKKIDKVCCRDFWKGRDSYRKLQDAYFNHVKSKGFDLERGMFVEDTDRKHYTVEEYKKITNFENATRESVYKNDVPNENIYCTSVKGKKRYINPLVIYNDKACRISDVSSQANNDINNFLNMKLHTYIRFDFDFKPYN